MNKVNNRKIPHLNILNQYIKDLSYENLQNNGIKNFNQKENDTSIDINVIYEPKSDNNFEVIIKVKINCKSRNKKSIIFHLELDYYGFFELEKIKNFDRDKLSSEGAKIIFPFARSIIANITQNGGNMPIILDNVNFDLMKS